MTLTDGRGERCARLRRLNRRESVSPSSSRSSGPRCSSPPSEIGVRVRRAGTADRRATSFDGVGRRTVLTDPATVQVDQTTLDVPPPGSLGRSLGRGILTQTLSSKAVPSFPAGIARATCRGVSPSRRPQGTASPVERSVMTVTDSPPPLLFLFHHSPRVSVGDDVHTIEAISKGRRTTILLPGRPAPPPAQAIPRDVGREVDFEFGGEVVPRTTRRVRRVSERGGDPFCT